MQITVIFVYLQAQPNVFKFSSFHFLFAGAVIDVKLQGSNASKFIHNPNWNEVSRDIVSIGDGIADTSHSNDVACEWAASLQRLALIYVQQAATVTITAEKAVQKKVKLSSIAMGGTGHGNKLNTRIAYIPVHKRDHEDSPLTSEEFEYFDGHLVDFIDDKIKSGQPIATTEICHDSCVAYDSMPVLIHEAKSGPDHVEMLKLLMGLCRMFPYCNNPVGWLSGAEMATFVKAEINEQLGAIVYDVCYNAHNDVNSFDAMYRVHKTIDLIKMLAGILTAKELNVDVFKAARVGTRDNPQKKSKQVYNTWKNKRASSQWSIPRYLHYALTNLAQRFCSVQLMIKRKAKIHTRVRVHASSTQLWLCPKHNDEQSDKE